MVQRFMATDLFLDHIETIAAAPGGVARLRDLILQFAMQGRLVEQNPADEPASVLLQRINGLRKANEPQETANIAPPYLLPSKWIWTSFDDIVDFHPGKTPPTKEAKYWSEKGMPWVSISDMKHYETVTFTERTVSINAEKEVFKGNISPAGTLLMSFKLTIGKVSILGMDAYHNEAIISIFPKPGILQDYLFRFLPILALQGNAKNAIKGNTLNKESLSKMLIPLPPALEQRRIVERVNQLMALCDALEERQTRQGEERKRLLASLIDALLSASNPDEVATAWARLRDSFDRVIDAPESVAPLRQAVLQLGVQGRLVEQDPADEPASVLLERIGMEKTQLLKDGKLKKMEAQSPIAEDKLPFTIPNGWKWTRVGNISTFVTSGSRGWAQYYSDNGAIFLRIGNLDYDSINLDLSSIQLVNPPSGIEGSRTKVQAKDILVSITGDTGMVGLVPEGLPEAYINQHIALVRLSESIDAEYVARFYTSPLAFLQLQGAQHGIKNSLGLEDIKEIMTPLPPLAEQHRIVERVDQLMVLCDELEVKLREERAAAARLAEVLCRAVAAPLERSDSVQVAAAIAPQPAHVFNGGETLPLDVRDTLQSSRATTEISPIDRQAIFLAWVVQRHRGTLHERTLGHVKAEKLAHLAEGHCGVEFGRTPMRAPRGPADFEQLKRVIARGTAWDAFTTVEREDADWGYQFVALSGLDQVAARFDEVFDTQAKPIAQLVELLVPLKSRNAEAVATLYAAWNDLLHAGEQPNNEQIFAAFHAWHPKKEHFKIEMLTFWIGWMRQHGLIPTGAAKPTKVARAGLKADEYEMGIAHSEPLLHNVVQNGAIHHTNGVPTQTTLDLGDVAQNGDGTYAAVKALLAERATLTNGDLQAALSLDAVTARALLRRLVAEGLARQEGQRRGMRYVRV